MTVHRITQGMRVDRSLAALQLGQARVAQLQEQLSSGRRINRPSDSPADTASAMRLRSSLTSVEQYARGAQDGLSRTGLVDATLGDVTDLVRAAQQLAVQGANAGAAPQSSRDALAVEVDQLRTTLLERANTTYLSRPVFGGVTAGEAAYDDSGTYVGTPGEISRRVGEGARVRVDVDGREVFGSGADSVFAELDDLAAALRSGDTDGVRAGLTALQARQQTVTTAHAAVGATYQRLERATSALEDQRLDLTSALSSVEDVDLPSTMVDLNLAEVAYQAALSSAARVVQPSLVDFLR